MNEETLDLLDGAEAIAAFTGLKLSQVYYQAKKGVLPITKQGARLIGSRSRLARHFGAERVQREPSPT
jgi:hypothetical protein